MQDENDNIMSDCSTFENSIDNREYSGVLNDFLMKFFSRLIFRKPF